MIGNGRLLALAPNARARLAWLLPRWADRHGQKTGEGERIILNLSQEALVDAAGMTRETVNLVPAELQRSGLIRVNRAAVHILQASELRRIALA